MHIFQRYSIKQLQPLLIKSLLFGTCIGMVYALYLGGRSTNIESLLIQALGGFAVNEVDFSLGTVIYFTPLFIQLMLLGNCMRDDLDTACAYIFTRTGKRSIWYYRKVCHILFASLCYWLAILVSMIFVGLILKTPIEGTKLLIESIYAIACTVVLLYTLFIIIMNVCTLRLSTNVSILSILLVYFLSIFIINDLAVSSGWLAFIFPATQGMLAAHDIPSLASLCPFIFRGRLVGFTPFISMIMSFIYMSAAIIIGLRILHRCNL